MDSEVVGGFCGVVLAGGTAVRMGGVDKAGVELGGRTLLDLAIDAFLEADEIVVVSPESVRTARPVTFVCEEPRSGGPVAGLLAGVDALVRAPRLIGVMAVDMPRVTPDTWRRLREASTGHDGAFLTDADGRRQLAGVVDASRLDDVRPDPREQHGMPLHRLLAPLDLAEVETIGKEAIDVDTWADLRGLQREVLPLPTGVGDIGTVNLHDWIDELSDVLDVEAEVDEGLVLDLARTAARNVEKTAAPITAYLLGLAAGATDAGPEAIEKLAARAQALAESWDRPADAPDPDDVDDPVPDDSIVDHSDDTFEA